MGSVIWVQMAPIHPWKSSRPRRISQHTCSQFGQFQNQGSPSPNQLFQMSAC
jgi:hypothetical protein